jgi:hypothetical protein
MTKAPQGDRSISNLFWLTDAQMARLEPFFPKLHAVTDADGRPIRFFTPKR